MVITKEDYQKLIEGYLDEQVAQAKQQEEASRVDVAEDLENLGSLEDAPDEVDDDLDAVGDAQGAPVINLVNKILAKGLQDGVSDIHIEPQEERLRVRFRKDGVLREVFNQPPIPQKSYSGCISPL